MKTCPGRHEPTLIFRDAGAELWACSWLRAPEQAAEFDLILNLAGEPLKSERHKARELEAHRPPLAIESPEQLVIDWTDYEPPPRWLPSSFWIDLWNEVKGKNLRALVFCVGGHGRTGTAVACLYRAATGCDRKRAIAFVRQHYCRKAVETPAQVSYVGSISLTPPDTRQTTQRP